MERLSAIKKVAESAKVPEETAKQWLVKQALWQVYPLTLSYTPHSKFYVSTPKAFHQVDLLFLPHEKLRRGRKVCKYAMTVVDVASCYKEEELLSSKDSAQVSKAFQSIYGHSPLTWPQILQVDLGREFMESVTKGMENHKTCIRCGHAEIQETKLLWSVSTARSPSVCQFGHLCDVEMLLPSG